MDSEGCNDLATVLRAKTNRRQALRGLAVGTVAGLLGRQETEAAKKRPKQRRKQQPKQDRKGRRDARGEATKHERERSSAALKVMTRNLYLGADLGPVFRVTSLDELVAAATHVFAMVQATDFPARAKALAAEIADCDAHIVGLQEVTLWRSQAPADFQPQPNAKDVKYDFLAILLDALADRGKHYEAVATVQNADAEAPRATPSGPRDTRYTDRDVILARTDLPSKVFSVEHAQSRNFAAQLNVPNPLLGSIPLPRGWTAVDVAVNGGTVRVVNTHLERLHPGIQVAQGNELLAGPLDTPLPVVLVGDLNSAAGGGGTPGQSDTPTYNTMIAAGFVDAWTATRGESSGFTWGHAEDLRNSVPTLTERIDFILTRGDMRASSANRVGDAPGDRTPSGLWPSDHAGVWAVLHQQQS